MSSQVLANEVAKVATGLIGSGSFLQIQAIDSVEATAYVLEIRKGSTNRGEWITILQRVITNPLLVEHYLLEKTDDDWEYVDPYLIKYCESSESKLEVVFKRLQRALGSSDSTALDQTDLLS